MSASALDQISVWIFDLDNTLYPASCNLFAQVSARITDYIARRLDLPADQARALQKRLFLKHGTTLRGLMNDYHVDPTEFLDYVHTIDVSPVTPSERLAAALSALPGRRLIYTNGSVAHARQVTDRLGITALFEDVFDIVAANYIPKPAPQPYRQLLDRYAIVPQEACMVEDMACNLVPAHALGMTTTWIRSTIDWASAGADSGDHIDHVADNLVDWLETATP
ncbi:MAG: pyrimidine 5'-nucleotidase [Azospirillaceae bacterium]|nr:pyrimidine 5'-nucleotidase [Azospirillaceae bacterium]